MSRRNTTKELEELMLGIVTCFFNPCGYKRNVENYFRFRDALGQDLVTVELSFNGEFVIPDAIQLRGDSRNIMWQKERLLNIGIASLPDQYDKIAWLDTDLLFLNSNWYQQTEEALDTCDVVQLCERFHHTDQMGKLIKTLPSSASMSETDSPAHPGGCWAARRKIIQKGLYDRDIVGGADTAQLFAWLRKSEELRTRYNKVPKLLNDYKAWAQNKQRMTVGYIPGDVVHLWHGDRKLRQYGERYLALQQGGFSPSTDIEINPSGIWGWKKTENPQKIQMQKSIQAYFAQRQEDGVGVHPPNVSLKTKEKKRSAEAVQKRLSKLYCKTVSCDVVIPYCLTNMKWVRTSVESILNQQGANCVIHAVADGFNDANDPLLELKDHPQIRLYRNKESIGPYRSCNRIAHYFETPYVAIQDSDDIAMPHRIAHSIEAMKRANASMYGGAMMQFDSYETRNLFSQKTCQRSPIHVSGNYSWTLSPDAVVINGTRMLTTDAFKELNGFASLKMSADMEFTTRFIRAGYAFVTDEEIICLRRVHKNSLSYSSSTGAGSEIRTQINESLLKSFERMTPGFSPLLFGSLNEDQILLNETMKVKVENNDKN